VFRNSRNVCLLLSIATLAASCSTAPPQPASSTRTLPNRAGASLSARPAISAADYVSRAGSIDLLVIEASELARQRSASTKIGDVADRLTVVHKRTSSELSLAGRRLNLLPSAALDAPHQAMLNRLRGAADIAREYKSQMEEVHREALALHSAYASHGSSPTLRPVAASIAPEMQQALRLLSYL